MRKPPYSEPRDLSSLEVFQPFNSRVLRHVELLSVLSAMCRLLSPGSAVSQTHKFRLILCQCNSFVLVLYWM